MPVGTDGQLTGIVGDESASSGQSRSGEDTRRRGWFWHWNSIVTQFAPIIGLKGVGLLNSYTVWTDRREESPHRGYAFPSQQSEAAFYGEDRNELITINKILVALDLIEIRKEMVPRTDEKGRRWKVPHNLYRVKDHGDDFNLTANDVMRVVRLADKDRAVYRYVRRIFSPKFAPIDRDNIWHEILEELRPTDVWQRLAARTERDETRASARSKAGHASRRTSETETLFSLPDSGDSGAFEATVPASGNDSSTGDTNDSGGLPPSSGATTNIGSATSVASTSNGSDQESASDAAPANTAKATSVAPTSTTYYQELTTTTTGGQGKNSDEGEPARPVSIQANGPGSVPDDRRDEDATVRLFDEANGRTSTAAARRHLKRIADAYADLARSAGVSGWALVGSAIDEAVSSGSAFVAPKRAREIIARWDRDGVPEMYALRTQSGDHVASPGPQPVTSEPGAGHRSARVVGLPNESDPIDVWYATCRSLSSSLPEGVVEALRTGVAIVRYDAGEVVLHVSTDELARSIRDEWAEMIQRKLGVVLRRPVRILLGGSDPQGPDDPGPAPDSRRSPKPGTRPTGPIGAPLSTRHPVPVFRIEECGMSSTQVWTSVLEDLRGSGAVPGAEIDTWLRDSMLIGRDPESDAFIVGVPHALAERRAARFRSSLETATMHIVGFDCEIEIVRTQAWLAARDVSTGTSG
jgi:hypothetical protein